MQQLVLLKGQMGEHLALNLETLKPHSSSVCCSPLASPDAVVIDWNRPQNWASGLVSGIIVSCWRCCLSPLDLFILKVLSALARSDACAKDWSNMKSTWQLGWATPKISIADFIWSINWSLSYHRSPCEPGWMIFHASWTIWPFSSKRTSWPSSSFTKSETWINLPQLFLWRGCSLACNHKFWASSFA